MKQNRFILILLSFLFGYFPLTSFASPVMKSKLKKTRTTKIKSKEKIVSEILKRSHKMRDTSDFYSKIGLGVMITGSVFAVATITGFIIAGNTSDLSLNLRLQTTSLYLGVPISALLFGVGIPLYAVNRMKVEHARSISVVVKKLSQVPEKGRSHVFLFSDL